MTGPEHYAEAERLSLESDQAPSHELVMATLTKAQVHATLALAAAHSTPAIPPGPCPVTSPQFMAGGRLLPREFCDLLAGHAGLHVAGTSVWGVGVE